MRRFMTIAILLLFARPGFACFPAADPLRVMLKKADAIFIADLSQSTLDTSVKRAACGEHYILSRVAVLKMVKGDRMPSMVRWPEYQSTHRTGRALVIMRIEDGLNFANIYFKSDEPELFAAGEKGNFSKLLNPGDE